MKKILSILVLVLFLASAVPITLAEPSLSSPRPEAIQSYNQIKERYQNSIHNWEVSKEQYLKAKVKVKNFNQLSDEEKEQNTDRINDFLLKTVERMTNHIEILQKWVEIVIEDEDLKEEMLNQLEEDLKILNDFKERLTTPTLTNQNLESYREISQEIKEFWRDAQAHLKKYHGIILSHRIGNLIEKSETISERFHEKLDGLDSNNKQVSEMQSLLGEFDEKITSAKKKYEEAKDIYNQMESVKDINSQLQEIKNLLREAHKYLREAHGYLRELIKLYREYTGEFPSATLTATNTNNFENSATSE
jgi:DNA repair exonuclease SbcCD ATPase subunit